MSLSTRTRPRYAFTLIEATVVLCILALLASGTMLVLSGPLKNANAQSTLTELAALDQWARTHSRDQTARLEFDLEQQSVTAATAKGESKQVRLTRDLRIQKLIVDGNLRESGVVAIPYRSGGCSTYAFLVSPSQRQSTWSVVCGPTGQPYTMEHNGQSEQALQRWFEQWSHPR